MSRTSLASVRRLRSLLPAFALVVGACGATNPQPQAVQLPPVAVAVSPASTNLSLGGASRAFSATVSNTSNTAVTWQVDGIDGGNSSVGTISAFGLYVSPAAMPSSRTVTISAVSVSDAGASGSAVITLTQASPTVTVAVTPAAATVQLGGSLPFAATVSNATNTGVTWQVNGVAGGNATVGTISASGLYTAPATAPAQPTVTISAVSAADPTAVGTAAVTVATSTVGAPVLGGVPSPAGLVGRFYDFLPSASDPNGLTLTFSIAGRPAWASFDSTTGELSGTPSAVDVGSTQITISASNGRAVSSLTFTLAVVQSAPGSATVSWVAPTTRTDGTPLTNLAGFRICFGTSRTKLTNRIDVTNSTVTASVVPNLTTGTWYFAVKAVDANGAESDYSTIASKTI